MGCYLCESLCIESLYGFRVLKIGIFVQDCLIVLKGEYGQKFRGQDLYFYVVIVKSLFYFFVYSRIILIVFLFQDSGKRFGGLEVSLYKGDLQVEIGK